MKPNKIVAFMAKQQSQVWKRFQLLPVRPSLDPGQPPFYLIDVQGERADGLTFGVTAAIDKTKFDLLTGQQAIEVARGVLNNAIQQLLTYSGCGCTLEGKCEFHKEAQA